jgi:hypothetical protein
MKIAFIYSKSKFMAKLCKFFTGSYCYHVAWVDDSTNVMYDMNLLRRKREWPHYPSDRVLLVESPVNISAQYLEKKLETDNNKYGVIDYLLFSIRPLFHLIGKSTPNAGGVICSEMVYDDLRAHGWSGYTLETPSPAWLEHQFAIRGIWERRYVPS